MTQHVIKAERNCGMLGWELTIYDDILEEVFEKIVFDKEEEEEK